MRVAVLEDGEDVWAAIAPDHNNTTSVHIFRGKQHSARRWLANVHIQNGRIPLSIIPPGVARALEVALGEF